MKRKTLYELFIGLLAFMLSIMIILDLMYKLPLTVVRSFYYINFIVSFIFLLDYVISLVISKKKMKFIINNIVDLLSIFPIILIGKIIFSLNLGIFIDINMQLIIAKVLFLFILIIKFMNKIKETVIVN